MRDLPKHVSTYRDRHGIQRWRWRKTGCKTQPFRAAFGTPEFDAELEYFENGGNDRKAGEKVYFIGGESGPVKIGVSNNPIARLASHQTSSPIPLRILAVTIGGRDLERRYHRRFADYRLYGEWFARAPSIEAEIEKLSNRINPVVYLSPQHPENIAFSQRVVTPTELP